MNKEDILKHLKENPTDLYDICEKLNLRFPYENKEDLMKAYSMFKSSYLLFCKKRENTENKERFDIQISSLHDKIKNIEEVYHLFSPTFDEDSEKRWIPKEYNKDAHKVFEFRKEVYATQAIHEDLELDDIIKEDMGYIWNEKGGQDGMYESFPITFTRESVIREYDQYNDYLTSDCHYTEKIIRSYALSSSGGIAIIENRTYTHYSDMTKIDASAQDSYFSRQQIITLGEDDGYHFLNSRRLYEECYFRKVSNFLELLDLVQKEFKSHVDS